MSTQDENTGLRAEESPVAPDNDGDLWQIGWKLLDLHKAVHGLARARQDELDAEKLLATAASKSKRLRASTATLKAEIAGLVSAK